ncbi:MAG: TetR/AcrR family transcriptional regulator [Chitinivorax sp.]
MGITERRKREKEALSRKIMDAAREIFVEEGYESVTMRRIADKIEYSATAIYSHFKDKDALIRAITYADFKALTDKLHEVGDELNPVSRMRRIAHLYVDFGVNNPNQYRQIFMSSSGPLYDEEFREDVRGNPDKDAYAWIIKVMSDALRRGSIAIPEGKLELYAQTLWSAFHGIVALHIGLQGETWVEWATMEERVDLLFNLIMAGIMRETSRG